MASELQIPKMRNELLSDVESRAAAVAKEYGLSDEHAEQLGIEVANDLANHWGGSMISFPKDHPFKISKRDEEIYEKFTGNNHGELARAYNITTRAIYKIVSKMQRRYVDARQPKLF
jgi:Mor family transcriptional regulator